MSPLFSIVVPTFNRADFICDAVESLLAQPGDDFEVIVVDDGSTDDTLKRLESYQSRIHLVTQPNSGPGVARNRGARLARGQFLAFMDSDDLWMPWTIATYQKILTRYNNVSFVTSVPLPFYGTSPQVFNDLNLKYSYLNDFFEGAPQARNFGSCVTLVRRDIFEQHGGFTEKRMNCEDLDFALKVGNSGGFVEILSPPLVAWRQHAGNLTCSHRATANGLLEIISAERKGLYPGGKARRHERQEIICRHVRTAVASLMRTRDWPLALRLFRGTFSWQLWLMRWKFLLGSSVSLCLSCLRHSLMPNLSVASLRRSE